MTDFLMLLHRDHRDLETGLDELLQADSIVAIRSALDGVRLGLTAHAEAEDIVFHNALAAAATDAPALLTLDDLVDQARSAHLTEEGALASLVSCSPNSPSWRDRVRRLRDLVHGHAFFEENHVVPVIRELAPSAYDSLAGLFATERLRQLSMLQPSAPIYVPELARAC